MRIKPGMHPNSFANSTWNCADPAVDRGQAALAEHALLRRLGGGDVGAWDEMYREHSDRVFRYCMAMCHDADLAADATQDAFVNFASNHAGFDPDRGALQGYLMGVARHAVLALLRERRRWVQDEAVFQAAMDASLDVAPSPQDLSLRNESAQAVLQALQSLPVAFREAIVLVDLQELSYQEAAALAGIELNTLRTRVHRGRKRLAELLSGL
jgi:RNA polymerase sigma-70 factor (ECF subfamily)